MRNFIELAKAAKFHPNWYTYYTIQERRLIVKAHIQYLKDYVQETN